MRVPRSSLLLPALLLLLPAPPAQAPAPPGKAGKRGAQAGKKARPAQTDEAAKAILAAARKALHDPRARGLKSWLAELTLHVKSKDLRAGRLKALHAFTAPGTEQIHFPEAGRQHPQAKGVRTALTGVWRDLVGAQLDTRELKGCVFQLAARAEGEATVTTLHVVKGRRTVGQLVVDARTGLLQAIKITVGGGSETRYTYTRKGSDHLIAQRRRTAGRGGRQNVTYAYSGHRKVNGHWLPTLIKVTGARGELPLVVRWQTINKSPALSDAGSLAETKEKIKAFKSGWSKWNSMERIREIKTLADLGGPEVAKTLAARLGDKDGAVKVALARSLGRLAEGVAVTRLVSAMGKAKNEPELFSAICRALGDIGDPKAVGPLAKGIFSGNRRERDWQQQAKERIDALGSIKDAKAVDELIALLGKCGGVGRRGRGGGGGYGRFHRTIRSVLQRLTGQEFTTQIEWRRWWKASRRTFKFK